MRALLVLLLGCAVDAPALAPTHPASSSATTGRLAGPPASLFPGVVTYPDLPSLRTTPPLEHHHH